MFFLSEILRRILLQFRSFSSASLCSFLLFLRFFLFLFLLLSAFFFVLSSFLSRLFVCLITMLKCVSTKMKKGRKHFSCLWNSMKNQCCSFFCRRSRFQKNFLTFLGRGRGGPRQRVRRALSARRTAAEKNFCFFFVFSSFSIKNLKKFQKFHFSKFLFFGTFSENADLEK